MSTFWLTWSEGVTTTAADPDEFIVQGPASRLALRRVSPRVVSALCRINPAGVEDQQLLDFVHDGSNELLPCWYYYLDRLTSRGLLRHSAHENGSQLATLVAISPLFVAQPGVVAASCRYVLSRFAYLRREGIDSVLESPLSHARLTLNDCRTAALIAALSKPVTPAELVALPHDLNRDSVDSILSLLLRASMLDEVNLDGVSSEDQDPSLEIWSFHDLLFHSRSRQGRNDAAYGGTYRFAGKIPPPAAIKRPMGSENYELYRPDIEQLERDDEPFAHVLERRRSIREFDTKSPVTARQLGEFLFRVGRTKSHHTSTVATGNASVQVDFAQRPYPSGGSFYEIEFYAAIQQCEGISPGLYHYAPDRHLLERIADLSDDVRGLLRDAALSTTVPHDELQVLFILTARIPRLAWKYESIAYALVLKHVGVIYQTMYLAATAMGLAPCAIGGGDADLFARAARIAYSDESSVGEFLLGSKRSELTDRGHVINQRENDDVQ